MAILNLSANKMLRSGKKTILNTIHYCLILLFIIPFMFVFIWMITTALKTPLLITATPPVWFFKPTFENFKNVFTAQPFFRFLLNSLIIGLGSTCLALFLGLPAGYSIARYKRTKTAAAILFIRMTPFLVYLIPWYLFFRALRVTDLHFTLILTHTTVTLPLVVLLMIGFFEDIPKDIEDAALIDGCTKFQTFVRISIPLVRTGIITASIISFSRSWNNFIFALILAGPRTRTVPLAVYNAIAYDEINWGTLTAAATLLTLPVLILTFLTQKHIIRGMVSGSNK